MVFCHMVTPDEIKELQGFKIRRKTPEERQKELNEYFRDKVNLDSNIKKNIKKRPAIKRNRRLNVR